jgi:hypothetical protein
MAEHYRCDQVAFLPAVLLQPGAAERDPDAAAQALRDFLAGPLNEGFMPATGWHRLGGTAAAAEFATFVDDPAFDSYVYAAFELGAGRWQVARWGSCQPRRVVQGNLVSLAWWLPGGGPEPTDRSLSISIVVDGCNAGPAEDAIQPPIIDIGEAAVTIILTGRRDARPDCPVGAPTPWTIDLPEEPGARALLDGSVFPARDATTEPLSFGGTGG